ncbi:MarR family transcriptional regulator [Mycobacterium malmoense]|uniref:MarR family transcriptional regulator n=1 Tax=Mycobacterium malmoense TaxID=1780 RepID=A0ABX3SR67_MYCMA|nr:MarR family transcriptional regulator [Mycobacterium malmoense]OIN77883.1 MarR family transcriptional regulator [Mycobacterium malmoense]ORA81797.1 MarR family transcriptional regulator [Mycobacterium malmoense]QZA19506.1 MarR family transcriptional regulator [Mycobacterium malmoense]UNB96257.1 MarR family transcriptional regulator [Mycobacterium malmoense]
MNGLIGGRTAGDIPGLDIAEQKSWQNFLSAAIRVYAVLNGRLVEAHRLSLGDVRLLHILSNSPNGSARMGDLAAALPSPPTRVTRKIRRLESQELVRRGVSPNDRRGVIATITDQGQMLVEQAMVTYANEVRKIFLAPLSQARITAMESKCRRIAGALKDAEASTNLVDLRARRPRHPGPLRGPGM